jgi:pilus assembly protein CpaE
MTDTGVIQVLFADDNQTKVDGVTRLLHFEQDIRVIGHAHTAAQALELLAALKPAVVLMDPGLPPTDGFDATRAMVSADPLVQVVMLSLESDAEGVRQAMRSGAVDYVSNYINGDRLAQAVREAAARGKRLHTATGKLPALEAPAQHDPGRSGKLIGVFSPKGGTGVTTLAVNLALALHTPEAPTVLVDADLQFGDVCAFVNLQPRLSIVDLCTPAVAMDDETVKEMLLMHESGLRVAPAPLAPELADEVTPAGFSALLESLRRTHAYVVVDAGSQLTDTALSVLEDSDLVLSVILPEIPSIKNTRLLLEVFFKLELPREKLVLVMNQVDRKEAIRADRVSDNLKHPVIAEIPFDREGVKDAINRGKPLLTDEKTHPLTRPLLALVGEIKQRLLEPEAQEA